MMIWMATKVAIVEKATVAVAPVAAAAAVAVAVAVAAVAVAAAAAAVAVVVGLVGMRLLTISGQQRHCQQHRCCRQQEG
jgi:hypothetical protein